MGVEFTMLGKERVIRTEMALIADLDLDRLTQLRHEGAVTNRKDRRDDLFQVLWRASDKPATGD